MDKIFQKIPFLRITLAYTCGIIIGNYLEIPGILSIISIAALLVLLIFLHNNYTFKTDSAFGFFVLVLFIFFGNLIFTSYNKTPHFFEDGVYVGTVLEKPQEKQNSYKSLINTFAVEMGDSTFRTNEKAIVYFSKNEKVKLLKPGQVILFNATPQFMKNYGNPYEFDYKSYLQRKRIYRQVYLAENSWKLTSSQTNTIRIYSELFREKLLTIYREQNLGSNETEILSALTLGYKRDLEPDTKRVFSAAGAMHVLAVSGLHVGILFMVFAYIFGFLRKRKTGKYIFVISAVLLLWTYTFITGLSPSVMRASTMFTIVIVGSNINRRASIYNSLAASALFLLLLNPNNLFEVGFQLSYLAVFGIVFLQPKLEKIWQPKNKILKFFWALLCVSIAAQLATFPLTSFYFSQFPAYFWLTNIIIIPAVTILIPLGILLLVVSKIPFISAGIAFIVHWLIETIYSILQSIEQFPYSTLEISLSPVELSCLLLFLFFVFIFIEIPKASYLKLALSSLCILFIMVAATNLEQYNNREIIVYNNDSNTTIHLITGRKNYIISENKIDREDFLFRQIQEVKRKKRLENPTFLQQNIPFENNYLLLTKDICFFEGQSIYYGAGPTRLPPTFSPNILISNGNFRYSEQHFDNNTQIIATQKVHRENNNNQIHSLKTAGAFRFKW